MLSEICGPKSWEIFEERGDLDFAYEMDENSRFRCNYLKQTNGYGAVFRLIPTRIASLEELGIPPIVKQFGDLRGGLVLVTGPTGSGKSTTLAALIDYINSTYARHIVTIEEPIEFVHTNKLSIITQREVPEHSATFPAGLKAALREDADIVLVGEMRDLETISLALTAAETGLLVFGTLHTNNARKTIDRMIDVFPADKQPQARTMLANSLRGVLAQLLLKRADGSGRLAVNEILISNTAVSSIIREGATQKLQDVIVSGKGQGMQFMDDAIWAIAPAGGRLAARSFHESDRQESLQKISPARGAGLGQLRRRDARRRAAASGRFRQTEGASRSLGAESATKRSGEDGVLPRRIGRVCPKPLRRRPAMSSIVVSKALRPVRRRLRRTTG